MNTKVSNSTTEKTDEDEPTHKTYSLWLPIDLGIEPKDLKYFIERVGLWAGKFKSTPESKQYEADNPKFIKIFDKIDEYYAGNV